METPRYLQVLWSYKWLVVLGLLIAMVCGFLAGYSYTDGKVESKATYTYSASTTVLLSNKSGQIFRSEIPGQTLKDGETPPASVDLSQTAGLYAYLISGDKIRTEVEKTTGPLTDTEDLTAVRRTTQPRGDESFPGRASFPIVEIVGISQDKERAQTISRTANEEFQKYVAAQQKAQEVPKAQRVQLTTIAAKPGKIQETSNAAIPVVITFLGVFLAFAALIFVLDGSRKSSARRRREKAAAKSARSDETVVSIPHDASSVLLGMAPGDDQREPPQLSASGDVLNDSTSTSPGGRRRADSHLWR
ncbi:hypothetical protein BH09ACT10_BH09ACT10_21780 [soil metagenome]